MRLVTCQLCYVFVFLISFANARNRIVGGIETNIENYPYQLQLHLNGHMICGAVLISNQVALTAGHCILKPGNYEVNGGTSYSNKGGTLKHVKEVVLHPSWTMARSDYDLAILRLDHPFKPSNKIRPIKLANAYARLNPGTKGNVTGYGSVNSKATSMSKRLHAVELPIVNQEECRNDYGYVNPITSRMFCAGYKNGGKDACQGDSGGPFAVDGVLYGIVSWGLNCAEPNHPGVFTSIPELRTYINLNTKL
ncbi:unnamed protein product [Brassicogethes aeneus]|uniref:trypsin n=1 Tax=Brassicogethes aeneus TaxID=1431903 RepID=A0A9P0FDV8_BRAAE|nr:unnamed protein product [Brassicogethes aeneus]